MKIIDPHLHLFDKQLGQYTWLAADQPPFWQDKALINRDFSLDSLVLAEPFAVAGLVHIEAGFDNQQPWREIQWLESLPSTSPMKTIACVDLNVTSENFCCQLQRLRSYSSLCGVRHILDDQATALLSHPQVLSNLAEIANRNLIFECQLNGTDQQAMTLLARCLARTPTLKLVINHAAFPPLDSCGSSSWQQNLQLISGFEHVYIKASGLEMQDRNYSSQHLQTIVSTLLSIFGRDKVMLASNFPLCLFSHSYQSIWENYSQLPFELETLTALVYENARQCYGFP